MNLQNLANAMGNDENYVSNLLLEKNASLELAEITSNEILKTASELNATPEEVLFEIGLEKAASFANDLLVYMEDLKANGLTLDEEGNEVPLETEKTASNEDDFTSTLIEKAREELYGK